MTLNREKVVMIVDRHHLRITIKPDGTLVGDKRELERLNRLYWLAEMDNDDLEELLEGGYDGAPPV